MSHSLTVKRGSCFYTVPKGKNAMKRWSFFTTLLVSNLVLVVAVLLVGFFITFSKVDHGAKQLTDTFQMQLLAMVVHDLDEFWPSVESRIPQHCSVFKLQPKCRLTVIDRQGRILGDSEYLAEETEPYNTQKHPEMIEALAGHPGQSVRISEIKHVNYRYIAEPVWHDGEVVAAVRVAFPTSDTKNCRRLILRDFLYGYAFTLCVAVVFSALLSWIWRHPLKQISHIVRNITKGDLGDFPPVAGSLDITELAENIDKMRRKVVSQQATITRLQEQTLLALHHIPKSVIALNDEDDVMYFNESAQKLFRLESLDHPRPVRQLIRHPKILDYYFRESKRLRPASADRTVERLEIELWDDVYVLELDVYVILGSSGADEITTLLVISDVTEQLRTHRMKIDFVANASHELRTPLATIRVALDNLIDGVYDDAESLQTVLQVLNRHVARLEALTEDLLSLYRVADKLTVPEPERTTIGEQQLWLDELFRKKAEGCGISLSFSPDESLSPFLTDNMRLSLILQNLVDNAIKFTNEGGKVIVRFAREGDSQLVITCTDTGCGIAPHEQDRAFERFYQSNASRSGDSRVRGTGLGLAIVKHAVERLNGTITLASRLGFGTTITVRIPVEFE